MNCCNRCKHIVDKFMNIDKNQMEFIVNDEKWFVYPINHKFCSNSSGQIIYCNRDVVNPLLNINQFRFNNKIWTINKNPVYRAFAVSSKNEILIHCNHQIIKLGVNSDISRYLDGDKDINYCNDYINDNMCLLLKHGDLSKSDQELVFQILRCRMNKILNLK